MIKKKSKAIFKIIKGGVYPYDVLFTVGTTKEEIVKYIQNKLTYKLDTEEIEFINVSNKSGRVVRFKNNALLLWVRNDDVPVLGHEIFHVVELIMEKINSPLTSSTAEPYAYLIEYYWRQILPFFKQ